MPGNPKVYDATSRAARAGVDKKAAAYARGARMYARRARSTALEGIHVGYLYGSAPTGAGLIFGRGQGRRRRRRETPQGEGSALIFIRALTNVRGVSLAIGAPLRVDSKTTARGRLARVLIAGKGTSEISSEILSRDFSPRVRCLSASGVNCAAAPRERCKNTERWRE